MKEEVTIYLGIVQLSRLKIPLKTQNKDKKIIKMEMATINVHLHL